MDKARILVAAIALAACLCTTHSFFLPSSWTSGWYKKPETSQWSGNAQEATFYTPHSLYGGHGGHLPLAVPYPVPVPAAVQVPGTSAAMSLSNLHSVSSGSMGAIGVANSNINANNNNNNNVDNLQKMHLVPCLCSVPKDDIDEAGGGSVVVQAGQAITN